jgi:hypothetical protein
MASTGTNQVTDLFKMRGTHRLLPYGGVTDKGGIVTVTAAAGVLTFTNTAAKVLLDTIPFTLAAGSTVSSAALPDGTNLVKVYVNPVREVLAVLALPPTGTPNQEVMLVSPAGDFDYFFQDIYRYVAGAWVLRDKALTMSLDPNGKYQPQTWEVGGSSDFRHLPFNKITGAVLAAKDEQQIIEPPNRGALPNHPGLGGSYMRFSAGFVLAEVKVTLTAGAIATPATDLIITRPREVDIIG